MAIRLHERFVIGAPVESVWRFMIDPRCVVDCVPGGELAGVMDDRNFRGRVRVVVGPLTLAYGGRIRLAELDPRLHRVRIIGFARETGGDDSARLTLDSWLTPLAGGRTEVVAEARVDVAGRIVELGGGFLGQLAQLVFRDFAGEVRARLETPAGASPGVTRQRGRPPVHALPLLWKALRAWAAERLGERRAG